MASMSAVNTSGLSASTEGLPPVPVIFGHSEPMRAVQEKVVKVASANIPVLIQGESGTGRKSLRHSSTDFPLGARAPSSK